MLNLKPRRLLLVVLALLLLALPLSAQEASAEVIYNWYELQMKLVKETPGFSPPIASRAFGYTGVTLYEAVSPGAPGYQSLAGQLSELESVPQPLADAEYHWPAVANSALASITRDLFPTATDENKAAIEALYAQNAAAFRAGDSVIARSEQYGQEVASAIFEWSKSDGGHEGYLRNFPEDYVPPVGEGLWVPTPRLNGADPQPALQPYWGNNRTLLPAADAQCDPPPPPAYSEAPDSQFYRETLEVYDVSQALTQDEIDIALFWADDPGKTATPPGHSIAILTQVLKEQNASLPLAAEAYAKVGIAVSDAFIGCWKAKFEFGLVRPVTVIQKLFAEDWMPIVDTPPFPEYTSGHSVQTGAAAAILTDLFGESYAFTDHTHDALGLAPRSFASFAEMAEEAAMSRLYGGIHYRAAIEVGVDQGECIGERVNALQFHTDAQSPL